MTDDASILTEAASWRRNGRGVAVATVVSTWGSSPRPIGSKLVVDDAGRMLGSVSGGCVEAEVAATALALIESGGTSLLSFGVADETAWSSGLACGGRIEVFVEALR